jgi:hypothetical protein
VAGAVFNGRLSHNLPGDYQGLSSGASINWKSLTSIQPPELKWEVLHAVSSSIQVTFRYTEYYVNADECIQDNLDSLRAMFRARYVGSSIVFAYPTVADDPSTDLHLPASPTDRPRE